LKQHFKQIFRQTGKLFTEKCKEADRMIEQMPEGKQKSAFIAYKESIVVFLAYT
jgi:hypothetical protein